MKSRLPIIVAVILGIVAVVAIQSYVKRIKQEAANQFRGRPVTAARVQIKAGSEITEKMLTERSVPNQFIPRQAIASIEEKRQVIGRTAKVDVRPGQLLLWSDLELEKRGGLSALIPEGERAFAVSVGEGINTELLQLNDRVDIIGIFQEPAESGPSLIGAGLAGGGVTAGETVCVVLLQSVNVMAIGSTIGEVYRDPSAGGGAGGGNITFSVTLPEAQLLMYASGQGELALVLRREGDVQVLVRKDLPRITMGSLEEITGQLDEERQTRIIQVMKGREIEEIKIEAGTGLESFE
jgi:Flp pilus assembly protein CpaB